MLRSHPELPRAGAVNLHEAGWGENSPEDAGAGFLLEDAEDSLCYMVGWGPFGEVTGATSLLPLPSLQAEEVGVWPLQTTYS